MKSQITTKTGDAGEAVALNGNRYSKAHPLMECVGAVDELRAHTALLRQHLIDSERPDRDELAAFLLWVLHTYFLAGAACSDPERARPEFRHDEIGADHLRYLEKEQARLEQSVQLPHAFIVCAGNGLAAQADVTAAVSRRFERALVRLRDACSGFDADTLLAYTNRLSDYLYMLARYLEHPSHKAVDYNVLLQQWTGQNGAEA